MAKLVQCNVCKEYVEIKKTSYRIRKSGDLEFRYLKCPCCGTAYLQNVTDRSVRKLLASPKATIRQKKAALKETTEQHRTRFPELVDKAFTS